MDKNPYQELKDVPREELWEQTNKNKKFLKKSNNKTTKKQFFKELLQNSVVPDPKYHYTKIDGKICSDLETCAKILEAVDLSKKLDLEVLQLLATTLCLGIHVRQSGNEFLETCFDYSRHGLLKLFFELFIKLSGEATAGERMPIGILIPILSFFNQCAMYKRLRKVFSNTENFDVISQPQIWEPIFFNSKSPELRLSALMFWVRISNSKSFTQDFVEKYVNRIREILPTVMKETHFELIQAISQKILESEHGNFFLKLVSELSEEQKSKIIAEQRQIFTFAESFRALVKCANCEKKEKSEKEFKKCSRCNFVYYCSKTCQRADWPSHKNICK